MTIRDDAEARHTLSLEDAMAQIPQSFGFDGVQRIDVNGEIFEIRSPHLRTEEQKAELAKLEEFVKGCDHDDVEVRNPLTNDIITRPGTDEPLTDKQLVRPLRKNGKLVSPSYEFRYLAALWGDDKAKRYVDAGGVYGLVNMTEAKMEDQFAQWTRDREARGDSKSN
jgi:hypothetical protein